MKVIASQVVSDLQRATLDELFAQIKRLKPSTTTAFEHFVRIFTPEKTASVVVKSIGYYIKRDTSLL